MIDVYITYFYQIIILTLSGLAISGILGVLAIYEITRYYKMNTKLQKILVSKRFEKLNDYNEKM